MDVPQIFVEPDCLVLRGEFDVLSNVYEEFEDASSVFCREPSDSFDDSHPEAPFRRLVDETMCTPEGTCHHCCLYLWRSRLRHLGPSAYFIAEWVLSRTRLDLDDDQSYHFRIQTEDPSASSAARGGFTSVDHPIKMLESRAKRSFGPSRRAEKTTSVASKATGTHRYRAEISCRISRSAARRPPRSSDARCC